MLNWYNRYDEETFQVEFSEINYKRYNPFNVTAEAKDFYSQCRGFEQMVS